MKNSFYVFVLGMLTLIFCVDVQNVAAKSEKKKDVTIQLYSVRTLIDNKEGLSFETILKELADMGYTSVEAANYGDGKFYGKTPEEFKTDVEEVLASDDFFTEKGKNMQNNLDLKEILWQNIVLEVPIRASKTAEVEIKKGEGWEMKDEFSKKEESGLECFKALLDEGKE